MNLLLTGFNCRMNHLDTYFFHALNQDTPKGHQLLYLIYDEIGEGNTYKIAMLKYFCVGLN
jgi:hypothetical protein